MVTKLVVIGDSFCHGVGTESPFRHSGNPHWSFGRYLADYYELDYVNLAEPGIGIARTVELAVQKLEQYNGQDCMVIAGWTNPRRIGVYHNNTALQLLPSYGLLGDTSDADVFVKERDGVRFVTNQRNQQHLDMLADLHRAAVENDLFEGQRSAGRVAVMLFRAWCQSCGITLLDFNVFPGYTGITEPELDINFSHVMPDLSRHPTKDEQQRFAELYILRYGKK